LVCRAWAAAAAGALAAAINCQLKNDQHCRQLQDWLGKHAGLVVALAAEHDVMGSEPLWRPLRLPVLQFKHLHSLQISGINVQLSLQGVPTRSSTRRKACGSLLRGPSSLCSTAAAATAAVLPQLQELKLCDCSLTLQLLSQLLSAPALTRLYWQSVELCISGRNWLSSREVWSTLLQQLQQLPNITTLQLHDVSCTAADIAPLSNMQHLQHFSFGVGQYNGVLRPGASALLAALQHLTQLRHLQLQWCVLGSLGILGSSSLQCFSALTASTQLTALIVVDHLWPIPKEAFKLIFPPGHVLPSLTVFRLSATWPCGYSSVEAAQIARIAASCPALQELTLRNVTPQGFVNSCLPYLPPSVTRFAVWVAEGADRDQDRLRGPWWSWRACADAVRCVPATDRGSG
jgi:hypothetical protein